MIRFQNWPERLEEYVRVNRNVPFSWGSNDCVVYVCNAIVAMTGEDPLDGIRGTYDSEISAKRVVIEQGGMERFFDARFRRHRNKLDARRGDIGLMPGDSLEWAPMGLCRGPYWCGPTPNGMMMAPVDSVVIAWAVGV